MQIASAWMTGVFLLAVVVQWNDPDPIVWMVGYGVAAALSFHATRGRMPFWPNLAAAVVFALWFASLAATLPGAPTEAFTSFKMRAASHEEPREAIGLFLCATWTLTLALVGRSRARRASNGPG